jgi:pimeloyl-ACP methyl ester carboxylesterase
MPTVTANGITLNYEISGEGEPLVLIPYLAADQACYAFQVAEYAKQFRCISVDPRGAGLSDKPEGTYTTELFADDIAAFMQALGLESAHVAGLSLGAAIGIWLAGKYPQRVKTLGLHSAWAKSDAFLRTVAEGWRTMARGLGTMPDVVITGIFPWCFTPDFYSNNPDYIASLADFVRGRPVQPVEAFSPLRPFFNSRRRCKRTTPKVSSRRSHVQRWSHLVGSTSSRRLASPRP